MLRVPALVVQGVGAEFTNWTIDRRNLGPSDVLIRIAYCGVCHSDISAVREEWGKTTYPLVPGHEIACIVDEVGAQVTSFQPGDRVGVGTIVGSCRTCENCLHGEEQYCLRQRIGTYNSIDKDGTPTYGGYSSHIVVDEHFVIAIPKELSLASAAPLMCAGITVYSPLRHWHAGAGKRVTVIGFGGLGHLAVKIAHALGAEVTVISRGSRKEADALRLGADHYFSSDDKEAFRRCRSTQDIVLSSISTPPALDRYLSLLRRDGVLVSVGLSGEPMHLHPISLLSNRRSVSSSNIGGVAETREMLEFCANAGVEPEIEMISAPQIDEAFERVVSGDVRYRFVLDTTSI